MTSFWIFYCWPWTDFTHCFDVFIVDFGQVKGHQGSGQSSSKWNDSSARLFFKLTIISAIPNVNWCHSSIFIVNFEQSTLVM